MVPGNFRPLYSPEDISKAVERVGGDISKWAEEVWEKSHTDILAIAILRGAIFFFSDLVRRIDRSVEIAPARTWAYENENFAQRQEVIVNIEGVPAKGRHVLIVDDICDTGRTLRAISDALLKAGACEVKTAVLIKRVLKTETFNPDWVCFEYEGPEWFVGYGMDDGDRWRNLPQVAIIQQS